MTQPDLAFKYVFHKAPSDSRRTLVMLHGTGGDEESLLPLRPMLDPDAALLSPRGRVSENGAPRFFRRLSEGVFDVEDLRFRAGELASFIQGVAEQNELDRSDIWAVGYSNGANIASAMMLLHPEVLAGAVLLRGMVPLDPPPSADLTGRHVLLLSGEIDPIVPRSNATRLGEILLAAGVDMTHRWLPLGHELSRSDVDLAKAWLNTR